MKWWGGIQHLICSSSVSNKQVCSHSWVDRKICDDLSISVHSSTQHLSIKLRNIYMTTISQQADVSAMKY